MNSFLTRENNMKFKSQCLSTKLYEHNQCHFFMECLWLLLLYNSELSRCNKDHFTHKA